MVAEISSSSLQWKLFERSLFRTLPICAWILVPFLCGLHQLRTALPIFCTMERALFTPMPNGKPSPSWRKHAARIYNVAQA